MAVAGASRPATKQEQREASVAKLVQAGLALFVSRGYRETRVDAVAAAAGLTAGSVYFYFHSKEGLLNAILDRVEATVVDGMVARAASAGPGAMDKIIGLMHGQARLGITGTEQVLLLILMSLEFAGSDSPLLQRTRRIYDRMHRVLEEVIEAGKAEGVFRTDLPTAEQAAMVMAIHDGTFLAWFRRGVDLDGGELVRVLRHATLGALAG